MAEAAEALLAGKGWLPTKLRVPGADPSPQAGAAHEEQGADGGTGDRAEALAIAAE